LLALTLLVNVVGELIIRGTATSTKTAAPAKGGKK